MRITRFCLCVSAALALVAAAAPCADLSETLAAPDRLVGAPGAQPLCPTWAIGAPEAVATIKLPEDAMINVGLPFHAADHLTLTLAGCEATTYTIGPNHVEKDYRLAGGLRGRSWWFLDPGGAEALMLLELDNPTTQTVRQPISLTSGAAGSFGGPDASGGPRVLTEPGDGRALELSWRGMRADRPNVYLASSLPTKPDITVNAEKNHFDFAQSGELEVPAGGRATCWATIHGERPPTKNPPEFYHQLARVERTRYAALAAERKMFNDGPVLTTPDAALNTYFAWTKCVPWKSVRTIPIGPPYVRGTARNQWWPVLSALVHAGVGVWANDCVETLWECSWLGPDFYPIASKTIESFYGHGLPESVEFYKADGTPDYIMLRIGQQPSWLLAAAQHLLIGGDKAEYERLWPAMRQVQQSLTALYDIDRDWLDDYSNSPFPEQPFTGAFSHEMLYANCTWAAALAASAEVARLYGEQAVADDLRWQAGQVRAAIEQRFGTDYGYASWLKVDGNNWRPEKGIWQDLFKQPHEQHPHIGHNMTFAVALGVAPPERAEKIFKTLGSPPMALETGPAIYYDPTTGAPPGGVWNYARWDLVLGLYRYGHTAEATTMLRRWVAQESTSRVRYQAVEQWGNTPDTLSQVGFVWTAGRALRAVIVGLFGVEAEAGGLRLRPRLPAEWPSMSLAGLVFRGARFDIEVARGAEPGLYVDGTKIEGDLVPASSCDGAAHTRAVRVVVP